MLVQSFINARPSARNVMRTWANRKTAMAVFTAAVAVTGIEPAKAANGSWIGPAVSATAGGDNTWSNAANWDTVPGNTLGAAGASTDIATFAGNPVEGIVVVDANRNIAGINFETTTRGFAIGTAANPNPGTNGYADIPAQPALYLTGGGTIQQLALNGSTGDLFSPLLVNGNSYTVKNPSTGSAGLRVRNTLEPSPNVNGTFTLTLDGSQGAIGGSNTEIHGPISDTANAIVSVVKNGPGTWEMNQSAGNPNTYSGDTIINGGALRTTNGSNDTGLGGLSVNSNYIINSGGLLRVSVVGNTAKSITVNSGGSFSVSQAASTTLNLKNETGPAFTLNYTDTAIAGANVSMPLVLTGTTPLQGGIKFVGNSSLGTVDFGGAGINLGTVLRVFDVGLGATSNVTPGSYDFRVSGVISGGSATGGLVKKGAGLLRLSGTNTFTGQVQIQSGTLAITGSDNALTGTPDLVINGGDLAVQGTAGVGAIQTFNTVTMTKGTTTAGSSLTSTLRANSFLLNVASPDTVSSSVIFADIASAAGVTKTGNGVATLSGHNTYTGVTTLNAGTLILQTDDAQDRVLTSTAGGVVNAGTLVLDYTGGLTRATAVKNALVGGNASNFASGQIHTTNPADAFHAIGWRDDIASSRILIRYTFRGDANVDGKVNALDFNALAAGFGSGTVWEQGDFDYDGTVGSSDFTLLSQNFNKQVLAAPELGTLVPEPSTIALATATIGMLRRRKRR